MQITGFKPGALVYASVTTVITTVASASTAAGFFLQAETSDLLYRVDAGGRDAATAADNPAFRLLGTAFESTFWLHNKAVQNLTLSAATSGTTVHARIQFFEKD